ncbi:MAG: hypothetical protein K6E55_10715 [Thermoguttaceae bacterium]|nr:hypothetical protein [Thermoguttaceae bacterium]
MSGIKGNWTVSKRDDGTGGNLEVANTLTADTLIISNSVTLPGVIIDAHSHTADAIVSGTIDADRLPKGDGDDEFGVIKIGTAGGLDLSDGILTIDAAALSTLLQLGTAAGADTGTASGNIPILDGSGRLPISVMPAQTIGGEYLGEVANAESMVILSQATSGDFCKRLDTGTYWMLGSSAPGAYSNAANWLEYAGAVTSVNGVIGAVTLSDLGLVTSVSVNSDTTFPSCKAVAGYIAGQISALNLAGTYATIAALNSAISGLSGTYATTAALNAAIGALGETYATITDLNSAISSLAGTYATISGVNAAFDGLGNVYAKLTDLAGYAVTGHQHLTAPDTAVPASGIITLEPNKTHYSKTITGNTIIGFDASGINLGSDDSATFELLLKMETTVYPVLFGSQIAWLNEEQPPFNEANTSYLCAFRTYDGGNSWVGAYQGRF